MKIGVVIVVAVVAIGATAGSEALLDQHPAVIASAAKPVAALNNSTSDTPEASPHRAAITLGEFNALHTGLLTYSDISADFGPGELQSSTNLGGLQSEMYDWSNADGSNMVLTFENNQLVSKSQFGLPPD